MYIRRTSLLSMELKGCDAERSYRCVLAWMGCHLWECRWCRTVIGFVHPNPIWAEEHYWKFIILYRNWNGSFMCDNDTDLHSLWKHEIPTTHSDWLKKMFLNLFISRLSLNNAYPCVSFRGVEFEYYSLHWTLSCIDIITIGLFHICKYTYYIFLS